MGRAFYLLPPGSWRDCVNLLHVPYTAWHLSYVVLGASLIAKPDYPLLGWTVLAFFTAMGIGAHALDELHGRPLRTAIPAPILWALGVLGPAAAVFIGVLVGLAATPLLLPFVALGTFLVFAYNLEWWSLHNDFVFAFAWGAFPVLTSYLAQGGTLSAASIALALCAAGLSVVQRLLSSHVRHIRRNVSECAGYLIDGSGARTSITRAWLVQHDEMALAWLSGLLPLLALGFLLK